MITEIASAWARASGHASRSIVEFNRAMFATSPFTGRGGDTDPAADGVTRDSWSTHLDVTDPTEPAVGDSSRFSKRITDGDVQAFAHASGDTNPLHLDDEFAEASRFGRRIAHGTLVSGVISAALARLPGVVIYLSQDVQFLKPVRIGDRVTAVVEVVEDIGEDRYRLSTEVVDDVEDPYLIGEAIVLIDAAPAASGDATTDPDA